MMAWSEKVFLPALVLVLVAFGGTVLRMIRQGRIRLTDFFALSIGAFNGVAYVFVLWATEAGLNAPLWTPWIWNLRGLEWLYPMMSLVTVLGVWIGEGAGNALRLHKAGSRRDVARTSCRPHSLPKWLPWAFLTLGVITYWLYTRAYGGFAGLLVYSDLIRSGRFTDIGISNPLSFLQRFGGLGMFSTLLFTGQALTARSQRARMASLIGLAAAALFSTYVLISWKGRLAILIFFTALLMGVWIYRWGLGLRSVIPALVFALIVILATIPLVTMLLTPGKGASSMVELLAKELSFPTAAFSAALQTPGVRVVQDMALWFLFFLPERVWRAWGFDTASSYITCLIMGAPKGEANVTGGIPADFLTFGFLQAGVIGVAVWSFMWGLVLGWLDRWLIGLRLGGVWQLLYAFAALSVGAMTVLYSDPEHIIERNLHFIIGCTAIAIMKNRGIAAQHNLNNSNSKARTCVSC